MKRIQQDNARQGVGYLKRMKGRHLVAGLVSKMVTLSAILMAVVLAGPAVSQSLPGGSAVPSAAAGGTVMALNFRFDGTAPSEIEFTFDGPVYGVYYNRNPLLVTYVVGAQSLGANDKVHLTDFALSGWTPIRLSKERKNQLVEVFLPVGLESDYRRITRTKGSVEVDAFEYTVVAAGFGLGLRTSLFNGAFTLVGLPYYGIATRSFGNNTDTSAILEVKGGWFSPALKGRFGLNVGYSYRWQKWYSDIGDIAGNSFDYVGKHHAVRIGLSF